MHREKYSAGMKEQATSIYEVISLEFSLEADGFRDFTHTHDGLGDDLVEVHAQHRGTLLDDFPVHAGSKLAVFVLFLDRF